MRSDRQILEVDRQAWRTWLEANASTASEVWLVVQKKHSPHPGLFLDDAVEEALCYGWIDSTLNTRDEHSYLLRFTPRKPDSVWSMNNIRRVEKLETHGLMKPPGRAAVREGKQSGQWQAAIDREDPAIMPPGLETALKQVPGAMDGYQRLPDSKKKQLVHWYGGAKREETKHKRTEEIIRMALAEIS